MMKLQMITVERCQAGYHCVVMVSVATAEQFTNVTRKAEDCGRFWPWTLFRMWLAAKWHGWRLERAERPRRLENGWVP